MQNITQSEDGFSSIKSHMSRIVSAYLNGYQDRETSIKLQDSSRQNFIQLKINDSIKTLLFKSMHASQDSFTGYIIKFESDNFDIFKEDQTNPRHKLENEEEIDRVLNQVMQIFEFNQGQYHLSTSLPKTCDSELKLQEDYFGELDKALRKDKDFGQEQKYFYNLQLASGEKTVAVCHSDGLYINSRNISEGDSNIYLINYHAKHQDVNITRFPGGEVDDLEEKKGILIQIIKNITKDKNAKFFPTISSLTAVRVDQVALEPGDETARIFSTREVDQVALEPGDENAKFFPTISSLTAVRVDQVALEPGMSMLKKTQQGHQAVGGDNFAIDTEHSGVAYHISSDGIPSRPNQDRVTQELALECRLYPADNIRPQHILQSSDTNQTQNYSCISLLAKSINRCLGKNR